MCGTCVHVYAGTCGSQEVSSVFLKPEAHYLPRLASKLSESVSDPQHLGYKYAQQGPVFMQVGGVRTWAQLISQ